MYFWEAHGSAQLLKQGFTVLRAQSLRRAIAFLWSVDAEPDLPYLGPVRPKPAELTQVARSRQKHRPGDRAVHCNAVHSDMLQDAIVSGGGAAPIVFRCQAVNRYD